jgi:hypothetical protein
MFFNVFTLKFKEESKHSKLALRRYIKNKIRANFDCQFWPDPVMGHQLLPHLSATRVSGTRFVSVYMYSQDFSLNKFMQQVSGCIWNPSKCFVAPVPP